MLFESIVQSGLYCVLHEIRIGVVNDEMYKDDNKEWNIIHSLLCNMLQTHNVEFKDNMKLLFVKNSHEYERPTLLHMRNSSFTDKVNTKYLYLHTKGIRWFNTPFEECIVDWIRLLLFWNVMKWDLAIDKLNHGHDTYGCNYCKTDDWPQHYSGNFFWTTSQYLRNLPNEIQAGYNDPEFWLLTMNPRYYNAYSSGYEGMGHYTNRYNSSLYDVKTNGA